MEELENDGQPLSNNRQESLERENGGRDGEESDVGKVVLALVPAPTPMSSVPNGGELHSDSHRRIQRLMSLRPASVVTSFGQLHPDDELLVLPSRLASIRTSGLLTFSQGDYQHIRRLPNLL